ncbi:MAG: hypothetical protein ACRDYB_04080 [Acidimicrobiales bacterium]
MAAIANPWRTATAGERTSAKVCGGGHTVGEGCSQQVLVTLCSDDARQVQRQVGGIAAPGQPDDRQGPPGQSRSPMRASALVASMWCMAATELTRSNEPGAERVGQEVAHQLADPTGAGVGSGEVDARLVAVDANDDRHGLP